MNSNGREIAGRQFPRKGRVEFEDPPSQPGTIPFSFKHAMMLLIPGKKKRDKPHKLSVNETQALLPFHCPDE